MQYKCPFPPSFFHGFLAHRIDNIHNTIMNGSPTSHASYTGKTVNITSAKNQKRV